MLDCICSYIGNLTVSEQVRARVEEKEKKICFHPVGNTTYFTSLYSAAGESLKILSVSVGRRAVQKYE